MPEAPFAAKDDLLKVPGITESAFRNLAGYVLKNKFRGLCWDEKYAAGRLGRSNGPGRNDNLWKRLFRSSVEECVFALHTET